MTQRVCSNGPADVLQALVLLGVAVAAPPADTVLELRRGDRVVLENVSGEITVTGTQGDRLELRGEDRPASLSVRREGSDVRIVPATGRGSRRTVEASLRVPRWVSLEIGGPSLDVDVSGIDGGLRIGNVRGDIRARDTGGPLEIRSISGEIFVDGARAGVRASSQSEDVTVRGATGPVEVHSGSGDVVLSDIDSESVRAETQDGDVTFSGTIARGGDYGFFVHDGDALVAIPSTAGAQVRISTFDGEFEADFPVVIERFSAGREFEFVLGDGGARLQIEVFDGEIRLLQR